MASSASSATGTSGPAGCRWNSATRGPRGRSPGRPATRGSGMDIDLSVLRSLESEKDISMDLAIKAIEDALLVAYHRSGGVAATARVEVDRGSGHVTVWGAGDELTFGEYAGREGDIVAGVIQQGKDPRAVLVDLGKIEAILPPSEQ